MHVVAPAAAPVSVIDPAPHSLHKSMADVVEYLPAGHALQLVAAALVPVLVIEPALHGEQYTPAPKLSYVPAPHSVQDFLSEPDWV